MGAAVVKWCFFQRWRKSGRRSAGKAVFQSPVFLLFVSICFCIDANAAKDALWDNKSVQYLASLSIQEPSQVQPTGLFLKNIVGHGLAHCLDSGALVDGRDLVPSGLVPG